MSKSPRLYWRRRQRPLISSPESHELRYGSHIYAIVQKAGAGWFSYSIGLSVNWNTSDSLASLEDAKSEALQRVRAALSGKEG